MQLSHVISDLVLAASAAYVWWKFVWIRDDLRMLWGVFFWTVAFAALFGAGRFASLHPDMVDLSRLFQQVASTLGAVGLALGARIITSPVETARRSIRRLEIAGLFTGLALFAAGKWKFIPMIFDTVPLIAMICVVWFGLRLLVKGGSAVSRMVGIGLVSGVVLSATAMIALLRLSDPWSIDLYHYFMAASMIAFGLSARSAATPSPTLN